MNMDESMQQALQDDPCVAEHPQLDIACTWLLPMCIARGPFSGSSASVPRLVLQRHAILRCFGDTIGAHLKPGVVANSQGKEYLRFPYLTRVPFIKTRNNWIKVDLHRREVNVATSVAWSCMDTIMHNMRTNHGNSRAIFLELIPPVLFHMCMRFVCAIGKHSLQHLWVNPETHACATIHLDSVRHTTTIAKGVSFVHTLLSSKLSDYQRDVLETFLKQHWQELRARLIHIRDHELPNLKSTLERTNRSALYVTQNNVVNMQLRLNGLIHLLLTDYGSFGDFVFELLPPELPNLPPPSMDEPLHVLERRLLQALSVLPEPREIKKPSLLNCKISEMYSHKSREDTVTIAASLRWCVWQQDANSAMDILTHCPESMLPGLCNQLCIIVASDIGVANPTLVLGALAALKTCSCNLPKLKSVVHAMCLSQKSRLAHWMVALYGTETGRAFLQGQGLLDANVACTPELITRKHPLAVQLCVDSTPATNLTLFGKLRYVLDAKAVSIVNEWHDRGDKLPTPYHLPLFLMLAHLTGTKLVHKNQPKKTIPPIKHTSHVDPGIRPNLHTVPDNAEQAWLCDLNVTHEVMKKRVHELSIKDIQKLYLRALQCK
jgi:hypothetical protein